MPQKKTESPDEMETDQRQGSVDINVEQTSTIKPQKAHFFTRLR